MVRTIPAQAALKYERSKIIRAFQNVTSKLIQRMR